eukprot:3865250-Rhodomonas_salina.1
MVSIHCTPRTQLRLQHRCRFLLGTAHKTNCHPPPGSIRACRDSRIPKCCRQQTRSSMDIRCTLLPTTRQ